MAISRPRIVCISRSLSRPRSRPAKWTVPAVTRADSGRRRISAIAVTLLPLPDSPTTPKVRPAATSKPRPLTASKVPRLVSKATLRSRTESSGVSVIFTIQQEPHQSPSHWIGYDCARKGEETSMANETGDSFRQRLDYMPIHKRPKLVLPRGARIAVWTIVNVENWLPSGAMPRAVLPPPMGQPLLPDVPNWAWHEYGMRVGFWRFLETLGSRGLKATFAVNGTACSLYREACEAARDAAWDFMGHGFVQKPMHRVEDQRLAIADTIAAIKDFTGKPPLGLNDTATTE